MDFAVAGEEFRLGVWIIWKVALCGEEWMSASPKNIGMKLQSSYKSLVSNGRSGAVEPCTFVEVPRCYESRRRHLLGIETKADISWAVLPLR